MRTLVKFLMLLVVLAVSLPAYGQGDMAVLVYKKTLNCWDAWEGDPNDWDVEDEKTKGFLILEVLYNPDGTISEVLNAAQIEYGKDDEGKWYEEHGHDFDVFRVVDGRSVEWMLVETNTDDDEGELMMLRGRVRNKKIGIEDASGVATKLAGNRVGFWTDGDDDIILCSLSLRLHTAWTKCFNEDGFDIEDAMNEIEDWLENKGYVYVK